MTFSRKIIELDIQLVDKNFQSGSTQVRIAGLPISVQIDKTGCPAFNTANVVVRGLSLERMETLSSISVEMLKDKRHKIQIWAGDDPNFLSLVFVGDIKTALADFSAAPDVSMRLECITAYWDAIYAQPPIAIKGEAKAADVVESLAKSMGYSFTNRGVDSKVKDLYLNGDTRTKMMKIANHVGATLTIDDKNVILAAKGEVHSEAVTEINKDTGLVGYPMLSDDGFTATCHFNPGLFVGSLVQLDSIVPRASGRYKVMKLVHSIVANDPDGGDWFTTIEGKFYHGFRL